MNNETKNEVKKNVATGASTAAGATAGVVIGVAITPNSAEARGCYTRTRPSACAGSQTNSSANTGTHSDS